MEKNLTKIYGVKVSNITPFDNHSWYIQSQDNRPRRELVEIANCYYKGHPIKFITWQPHFNDNSNKKLQTEKWMECANIPPKLNEINIINRIGQSLGNLIGFEVNHYKSSKIRFLVSMKEKQNEHKIEKIITNRSVYKLTFTHYEGEINEIIEESFRKENIKNNLKEALINIRKREKKVDDSKEKRNSIDKENPNTQAMRAKEVVKKHIITIRKTKRSRGREEEKLGLSIHNGKMQKLRRVQTRKRNSR